jgi:hypothetical protein
MSEVYGWIGFLVVWSVILGIVLFAGVLAVDWLFHEKGLRAYVKWDRFGLYVAGWRLATIKQRRLLEELCVERHGVTDWIYRNYTEYPSLGVCLYWSHVRDRDGGLRTKDGISY